MIKILELYKNHEWVESFLIISICLFVTLSIIIYLLIISSRSQKIKKEKLRAEYEKRVENLMFLVIFEGKSFSEIKENTEYESFSKVFFFQKIIIESIINLHKNYEGIYAQKLEQFYKESGLINTSFKKLKNLKWEIKCKGITELAEMNITEAVDQIITIPSKTRNKILKITAVNACIKLDGEKSIGRLIKYNYPIDDWTQINIIHAFKKYDMDDIKGIELLLESQNTTVIALGLKLIKEMKLTQKLSYVAQLADNAQNGMIKYEAQSVLQELTV